MASNKKYTVFVSSTFEDLRDERDGVSKAVLLLDHIPIGMEMFSASDEQQWQLIRRQIDQADYYIVIVAHRYGSMVEGISYTEREYNYAVEQGVPVLGFVIDPETKWPGDQMEDDQKKRLLLDSFKEKVGASRMRNLWTSADDLKIKVLASLAKEIKRIDRPGWIRGDEALGGEVIAELSRLRRENSELRAKTDDLDLKVHFDITRAIVHPDPTMEYLTAVSMDLLAGPPIQNAVFADHRCFFELILDDLPIQIKRLNHTSNSPGIDCNGNYVSITAPGELDFRAGTNAVASLVKLKTAELRLTLGTMAGVAIKLSATLARSGKGWVYPHPEI